MPPRAAVWRTFIHKFVLGARAPRRRGGDTDASPLFPAAPVLVLVPVLGGAANFFRAQAAGRGRLPPARGASLLSSRPAALRRRCQLELLGTRAVSASPHRHGCGRRVGRISWRDAASTLRARYCQVRPEAAGHARKRQRGTPLRRSGEEVLRRFQHGGALLLRLRLWRDTSSSSVCWSSASWWCCLASCFFGGVATCSGSTARGLRGAPFARGLRKGRGGV